MPGHSAGVHTCGFSILNDPDFENAKCAVAWGVDVDASFRGNYRGPIRSARKKGAKLIVIDPRKTPLAEKADIHLQVRPGTDCALALGILHVIINEDLYAKEFVDQWTIGFDELKAHVQEYTPQKVSEMTWIPLEKIVDAARMYAQNSPAAIGCGIGGLCQNTNSFQTNRAIAILTSVTGNLDIPGGQINHGIPLKEKATMISQYDIPYGMLTAEQISKRLNIGKVVKADGFQNTHPEALWPAIMEGTPYPVKAMLGIAANPVITSENSKLVRDALLKLDFFAISDLFMTPTTEIADIVLPAVHWSERDEVVDSYTKNYVFCHPKIVDPPEGCREDKELLIDLAENLGLEGYYQSVEESLNDRLKRLNMTFEEFKEMGFIEVPVEYKKHEKFGAFKTRSKKVELYSESLKKIGSDPLPVFKEPPESPVSTPELAEKYPLVLITGANNTIAYFHSALRNVPSLRKLVPEPLLTIHPEAAKERGINEGDWIEIETQRGVVKHKAKLSTDVDSRVVAAPHGWWYGYKDGWKEVNINVLTEGRAYDPDVGSGVLKGLLCQVRKTESPPVEI
jgi:anaerobic selenocysteine-containing dehydrogenase